MDHNALLARTLGLLLLPCQLLLLSDGLPVQHVRLLHLMHSEKRVVLPFEELHFKKLHVQLVALNSGHANGRLRLGSGLLLV